MGQGQSSHKISAQDKAILQMKNQRDKLQQYQKRLAFVSNHETEIARECLRRGDKKKALIALRRKKYQESLIDNTDKQLAQLEQLVSDVEFARIQADVLYGLKQGTDVLKMMHKEIGGIEGVDKLLGDAEEARAYVKEVNEMLAGQMSNQDEDEVEEELEALANQVNGIKVPPKDQKNQKVDELPNAPNTDLPQTIETDKERWERRAKQQQEELIAA